MRPPFFLILIALGMLLPSGRAAALDPARTVDEYTVAAWTMEDGLPHNLIQSIAQSPEGFLWIGTWEGPARFNGRNFTAFDARSLAGPGIVGTRALLRDTDGSMLFGTTQFGVHRLRGDHWQTLGDDAAARLKVTNLLRDRNGTLWIGTEDTLFSLDADGNSHATGTELGLKGNLIYSLLELDNGDLLIGNTSGLHRLHDGRIDELGARLGIPARGVRSLLTEEDGRVLIGGDSGVWRLDADLGKAEHILDFRVEAMLRDRHGALWISTTSKGLIRRYQGRFETIDQRLGLIGRGSSALFEDREGLLWVGTNSGLYRISDSPVFGIDRARGLADGYMRSMLQTSNGAMWLGHAVGLDRWIDGEITHIDISAYGQAESSVLALAPARDGGIWIGSYDQGVLYLPADGKLTPETRRQVALADGLPSNHIRSIIDDTDGSLWIGSTEGLARYHEGKMKIWKKDQGLPSNFIRALHKARDGALWIGTATGIARLEPDGMLRSWHADREFPGVGSFDFLEDADGSMWIASDRGLLRLRNDRFTIYNHEIGLPSDTIFRVLDDGHDNLWLSTNRGVIKLRRDELAEIDAGQRKTIEVEIIDQADGMPSSQANGGSTPAGWKANDGRLWIPTASGVAIIDPALAEKQTQEAITVAIETVRLDDRVLPLDAIASIGPETRRLVIGYAGLSFRGARDIRYRYRLLGLDPRWFEAGNETEAVFTRLPPGRFTFEVQALRQSADWEHAVKAGATSLAFEIRPPFWRTTWFVALCAALVIFLLGMIYRWRVARYQQRQREMSHIIDERTQELSEKNAALEEADHHRELLLLQLAHQANHDVLTELPNRRAGDAHLAEAIERAHSGEGSFSVALLDIDRFKRINDQHGHEAGDAVLKMVASAMRENFDDNAFAARHGGEEFMISCSDQQHVHEHFEQLRARIAATPVVQTDTEPLYCTVSIGVASWSDGHDARSLLALADKRLYRAKQQGRNRVVSDDEQAGAADQDQTDESQN